MLLTACSAGGFSGLYNTPLPGGADLGDHPYRITAQFSDVLDLVPQASVKVNDVAVGRVEKIDLAPDTRSAVVSLAVNGDIVLPDNAGAELRPSSCTGHLWNRRPAGLLTAPVSHSPGRTAIPRWKRCSARFPCCSTVVASSSCRRSVTS
jgi:hypothetical protein